MLVKNLTPFVHGTKVTARRPRRPEMTLVVKGTFRLVAGGVLEPVEDQPPLSAERFVEGDDERAGECVYPGDFADFKQAGEVMLRGTAHAPAGRSMTEMDVRLSVGEWSKQLRVYGPRVWEDGAFGPKPSEPKGFTKAELSFANAFGGTDRSDNPVGKGAGPGPLPQVELVERELKSPTDALPPATFAPINPAWAPRAGKVGKEYGAKYKKERAPFYAEDFEFSFFQSAPRDQQIAGYFRGDEEITLHHLRADAAAFRTRLPSLRLRAFTKNAAGAHSEIKLNLDTVFVEPDAGTATLVWRGLGEVAEIDLTDVTHILVASEPLGDKPLPASHYRAALEAFADDPIGLKSKLPEGFEDFAERSRKSKAGEPLPEEPGADKLDPVSRMLKQRLGAAAPDAQKDVAAGMSQAGTPPKEIAEELGKQKDSDVPPVALFKKPGVLPNIGLRRTMRQLLSDADRLEKSFEGREVPPEVKEKVGEIRRIVHEPALSKIDPSYTPPIAPLSTDEPGPYKNLKEHDLSGKDLSGKDLSGANLEDALLLGTNLRGAKLVGANLRRAVLFKADLSGADLSGADLTQVNGGGVRAADAKMRGCKIVMAFFEKAVLEGADFTDAEGEYPAFCEADLRRAKLDGAKLERADFTEAQLEAASFRGATLTSSTFEKAAAKKAVFTKAKLDGARFPSADLGGANFEEARGERANFTGAILDKADLSDAWFLSSHFTEASAKAAVMARANLRLGRFYRTILAQANLSDANLFGADLTRAEVTDARFVRANMYEATLLEAHGAGVDLTDANLIRAKVDGT